MKRPLIGIVPLVDAQRESYWMLPGYMRGVEQAGGLPIMLPLTDDDAALRQLADTCDGFLLTGGQDVSPALYGAAPVPACGETCPARDAMETKLLALALEQDKPVLGICRGIQFLNVYLGGTLYQDLPTEHPSAAEHHQKPPYDVPVHSVTLVPARPLYQLLGKCELAVNSLHHQAIRKLAPTLQVMALSEDGIPEAICLPGKKFVWAVQWHPEYSFPINADSRKIFAAFVGACQRKSLPPRGKVARSAG